MALIQIILIIFSLFALSRVILRFRSGQIRGMEFVFWSALFSIAIIGTVLPGELSRLAALLGIGRGVDLITYASIAILFYLVFRLYVFLEDIRHEITQVIRLTALKEKK